MPFATFTVATGARFPLVQGRPWSLPATWRQPAAAGQTAGSGALIDLTGAQASCTLTWPGGSIQCAMAALDQNGAPTPSLLPSQTDSIPAGLATAHLNITDTAGNTYDFQIPLQVVVP